MKERTLKRRVLGWSGVLCAALLPACSKVSTTGGSDEAEALGTVKEALTLSSGTYEIRNVNSGKCLDVADWSTVSGDNVQQWACNATSPSANQRFVVASLGNGEFSIVNVHSGMSLDMETDPCAVQLFDGANYTGTSNCYATGEVSSMGAGFNDVVSSLKVAPGYRVRLHSDPSFAGSFVTKSASLTTALSDPDLAASSFDNITSSLRVFTNVRQGALSSDQNGNPVPMGAHQKFKIEDASGTGQYTIKPVSNQTHCVDIDASSSADGANVQVWACNGSNAQRFTFNTVTPGTTTQTTVRLNDDFASYMTNGVADPAKLVTLGQYEWRDDTTQAEVGCRFTPSMGDIQVVDANNPPANRLLLKADNTAVLGDGWRGDRPCRSAELRYGGLMSWYGDLEARMRAVPAAGSNPGGKTGFMLGLFTGEVVNPTDPTSVTNHRAGLELTGLRLNQIEASLTSVTNPECSTFHECVGNYRKYPSPTTSFVATDWHDYKVEWRWHYVKYYVDGTPVLTIRRPRRSSAWDDPGVGPDVKVHMSFTVPDHRVQTSYGGTWVDAELAPANNHHAEIEWVKFTSCDNGPDCALP